MPITQLRRGISPGQQIGTGLAAGLEQLAKGKLAGIQRERRGAAFEEAGLPREFADIDPKSLQGLMSLLGQREARGAQAGTQEAVADILGVGAPEEIAAPVDITEPSIEAPEVPQVTPPVTEPPKKLALKLPPGARSDQLEEKMNKRLARPGLSSSQQIKIQEQIEKKQEKLLKKQDAIDKATQKTYEKISESGKTADEDTIRLDQLLDLIETGNLNNPTLMRTIKAFEHKPTAFKIPILGELGNTVGSILRGMFVTPETEEFEKISTDFLKSAKTIFGNRLTDTDLKMFLKTVPTTGQSDEAKMRVIRNLRVFFEGSQARNKAMDSIIEEHGGFRPRNLDLLIKKRVKPELDRIAKQIKQAVPRSARELKAMRQTEEALISPRLEQEARRIGTATPEFRRRT